MMTTIETTAKTARQLSDSDVLARLEQLVFREREITIEILQFLNEVERRKLHNELGYSSMFAYCTRHLGYSESAAGRRVLAARCLRDYPLAEELLRRDEINLMTLCLVATSLTRENADNLLNSIRKKSRDQVEAIASMYTTPVRLRERVRPVLVAVAPTPMLPDPTVAPNDAENVVRASATARPAMMGAASSNGAADGPPPPWEPTHSHCGSEKSPNTPRVIRKHQIQFLVDDAFMRKYCRVCAMLSNRIGAATFEKVFGALLDDFMTRNSPERRQERREKRQASDAASGSEKRLSMNGARTIPAFTRDAVFLRDHHQCTFVGPGGRCGQTHNLHVDHIQPVARGGTNDVSNLRLLCSSHNQLEADRVLGKVLMDTRRSAAREIGQVRRP